MEQQFTADLYEVYRALFRATGYRATEFLHLITIDGAVAATRRALAMPEPPGGFHRLAALGQLALSVEAHVLLPRYGSLFTPAEREIARERLAAYGFTTPA